MIPKSFKIFGHTVKVKRVKSLKDEDGKVTLGESDIYKNEIRLLDNDTKFELTQSQKEQTFYHELVHMILDSVGREDLSEDESLVDLISGALHQFIKTSKY
jgi:hypothetical protein